MTEWQKCDISIILQCLTSSRFNSRSCELKKACKNKILLPNLTKRKPGKIKWEISLASTRTIYFICMPFANVVNCVFESFETHHNSNHCWSLPFSSKIHTKLEPRFISVNCFKVAETKNMRFFDILFSFGTTGLTLCFNRCFGTKWNNIKYAKR